MPTTFEIVTECACPPEALFDASLSIDAHALEIAEPLMRTPSLRRVIRTRNEHLVALVER